MSDGGVLRKSQRVWTAEMDARLSDLAGGRLSYAEIAAELGVTKNQAVGRAWRMGIRRCSKVYERPARRPVEVRPPKVRDHVPKAPDSVYKFIRRRGPISAGLRGYTR